MSEQKSKVQTHLPCGTKWRTDVITPCPICIPGRPARKSIPPSREMMALIEQAADLLSEVFPSPHHLLYWSRGLLYLGGSTPAEAVETGDVEQMKWIVTRLAAMAEGVFA